MIFDYMPKCFRLISTIDEINAYDDMIIGICSVKTKG
jgi:hypothetical protein